MPVEAIGTSRAPHGARGLKLPLLVDLQEETSRAPHGARGLKLTMRIRKCVLDEVAPRTGRVD